MYLQLVSLLSASQLQSCRNKHVGQLGSVRVSGSMTFGKAIHSAYSSPLAIFVDFDKPFKPSKSLKILLDDKSKKVVWKSKHGQGGLWTLDPAM